MRHPLPLLTALAAAALIALPAGAQTAVSLQGMMGNKALLMIGGAPHTVAPGETYQGVKVISTSGDQAVVQVDGQRFTLRVGEAPASVGAAPGGGGDRIALTADSSGHFFTLGSINDRPVQFMVDTGASLVAISKSEADRLGLNYQKGRRVNMGTANGVTAGWTFRIPSMRVGDVVTYDVEAVVTPSAMPMVLLGSSYLMRFDMRRTGDQMMLIRR